MKIYSKIDKGVVRQSNQDAFLAGEISPTVSFAVVCDGMGGANAGNIASETAIKCISEYLLKSYRENMTNDDIEKLINNAIISANIEVFEKASKNEELKGMGTTAVVAVINNGIGIMTISKNILSAEKHLKLCIRHCGLKSTESFPRILVEESHAGVEGCAAPCLQRMVSNLVHGGQDREHLLGGHAGSDEGLVRVTQNCFGNFYLAHINSLSVMRMWRGTRLRPRQSQ